jgi:GH24 family phage-related lysozyme (muramidase)
VNAIHPDGVALIKEMELFVAEAYPDHGGRLAQGYGHSVGEPVPALGTSWTEEYASQVLEADLARIAEQVRGSIKVDLNDRQFGAVVSLVFNRGIGNFRKTKVLELINSPDISNHLIKAGCAFVDEENCRAKDKDTGIVRVFLGLKMRRIKEASLFLTKV